MHWVKKKVGNRYIVYEVCILSLTCTCTNHQLIQKHALNISLDITQQRYIRNSVTEHIKRHSTCFHQQVLKVKGYTFLGSSSLIFIFWPTYIRVNFNPLHTGGRFNCYMLDESICQFSGLGSILSLLICFLMGNPVSKQCRLWSDATLCGI